VTTDGRGATKNAAVSAAPDRFHTAESILRSRI
jgi:hypothetical protein